MANKLKPRNTAAAVEAVANAAHVVAPTGTGRTTSVLGKSTKSRTQRFNALFPIRLYNRMKRYSDETGISMKAQAVEAINKYLDERNY